MNTSIFSTKDPLDPCYLCPRRCGVRRSAGIPGRCGETSAVRISRAALHFWEEPCISGTQGSGTVFFTGCSLHCVFCQNYAISGGKASSPGKTVSARELADIFLDLQAQGANNINLVTPTHFVPQIANALQLVRGTELTIPVVYNTSSYETVEMLRMMDGLVDIYLPDLKYVSSELSGRYSHAPDYFNHASAAIDEMVRQVGEPVFDNETELMKRGVIVRHMVLPGCTEDSKAVIDHLYNTYGDSIFISILHQYTPLSGNQALAGFPELARPITDREYDEVVDHAIDIGVENGFIQEDGAAEESFVPVWWTDQD